MTPAGLTQHAETFRAAVEMQDFSRAQASLREYVIGFRSRPRTSAETEDARRLLQWGIDATNALKAQMVEELMLLKRFFDAYGPPKRTHTWRIEG
jgi:hypothetical protein